MIANNKLLRYESLLVGYNPTDNDYNPADGDWERSSRKLEAAFEAKGAKGQRESSH